MRGKTVLITGADGDIGRETTRGIAARGAAIVMACIELSLARPVCEAIKKESGNANITLMQIDLSSQASIREFAQQFSLKHQSLDVLINNAGVYCHTRQETRDGFEKTIGINLFGHFLLSNLLLPVIKQTAGARIINLSSNAHYQSKFDVSDINWQKRKYSGFRAYADSKLAIVLFTQELAKRLMKTGTTVNAVHPGHTATQIWNIWPGKWYQALLDKIINRFMITAGEGAQASIFLASSEEVKAVTGKYFSQKQLKDPAPKCKDVQLQTDLWQLCENLTGISVRPG
jgi:NAD(P)-dependent dehydrogenase (short-subunit alcohol dehydrogenase family)